MTGKSKVLVTEETIREALAEHFNQRVLRDEFICTTVDYEYKSGTGSKEWFVVLEPHPTPIPELPPPELTQK